MGRIRYEVEFELRNGVDSETAKKRIDGMVHMSRIVELNTNIASQVQDVKTVRKEKK